MAAEGGEPDQSSSEVPVVPALNAGDMPLSILVDYDGTIALTDVSDLLIDEFIPAELATDDGARYMAGLVGSRELMEREVGFLPPDRAPLDRTGPWHGSPASSALIPTPT